MVVENDVGRFVVNYKQHSPSVSAGQHELWPVLIFEMFHLQAGPGVSLAVNQGDMAGVVETLEVHRRRAALAVEYNFAEKGVPKEALFTSLYPH